MHLLEFPSSISVIFLSGFIFGNVNEERLLPVKSRHKKYHNKVIIQFFKQHGTKQ